MDYWLECVKEAFEDADIAATDEQIEIVADWIDGAHENYGLATGRDCIPNPLQLENEKLKRELEKERDKIPCPDCKGTGEIITRGPYHSGISSCSRCRGEGKCLP